VREPATRQAVDLLIAGGTVVTVDPDRRVIEAGAVAIDAGRIVAHLETPSPHNPLGVKGLGEGGAVGSHAAIANAVEDALAHTGARVRETPLRPAAVWKLLSGVVPE
jgi:CO/xanthine dehydrogenase Mo-binding subunit